MHSIMEIRSLFEITFLFFILLYNLIFHLCFRFNQQNKEIRFGNFVFGPVVMRMYHKMNKHEEAYKVFYLFLSKLYYFISILNIFI